MPLYKIGKMDQSDIQERFFDENEVFYDISIRNKMVLESNEEEPQAINASEEAQEEQEKYEEETQEELQETSEENGKATPGETEVESEMESLDEETDSTSVDEKILIEKYREWKAKHPKSKFSRFIETLPKKTIKEIEEGADNQ